MLTASHQQDITPGVETFSVAVHPHHDRVVVAPSGELDLATAAEVDRELAELRDAGFADIVLDLRGVTFIDSSGLSLLLRQREAAQAAGHRLRLVEGCDALQRLLALTGTADLFEYVGPR